MRPWLAVLFVIAGSSALQAASAPVPAGPDFQVNTYTPGRQGYPAVSLATDGGFVVVWESGGSNLGDNQSYSIQGQRHTASGTALGVQFEINSYSTGAQKLPAVSRAGNGDFVVVWQSVGSPGNDNDLESIQGRRYAAGGAPQGGEFQVNTFTTSQQRYPSVAASAAGDFLVAWRSFGSVGNDNLDVSVQGQRYATDGSAQGIQFQINSYTPGGQSRPAVSRGADGDFVVAWQSYGSGGSDTSSWSIQRQHFAADGTTQGGQFQVNSYTYLLQTGARMAHSPGGDFVVAWQSYGSGGSDTSASSIQGQRFAAGGAAQGNEFQVNTYTTSNQTLPAVAVDADGDFVVVWQSTGAGNGDSSGTSLQGQRYAADGTVLGGQFLVNSYTRNNQFNAAVALAADGDFVVVWQSDEGDGNDVLNASVQGRRFRVTGDLQGRVFLDQNGDGIQGGAEPGVAGIAVELYDASLLLRGTTVTNAGGDYTLKPKEGNWHLRFVAPPGSSFTAQDVGGDDTVDSDADPLTGETDPFAVSINVLDTTVDAGISALIFVDGFGSGDTTAWSSPQP